MEQSSSAPGTAAGHHYCIHLAHTLYTLYIHKVTALYNIHFECNCKHTLYTLNTPFIHHLYTLNTPWVLLYTLYTFRVYPLHKLNTFYTHSYTFCIHPERTRYTPICLELSRLCGCFAHLRSALFLQNREMETDFREIDLRSIAWLLRLINSCRSARLIFNHMKLWWKVFTLSFVMEMLWKNIYRKAFFLTLDQSFTLSYAHQ